MNWLHLTPASLSLFYSVHNYGELDLPQGACLSFDGSPALQPCAPLVLPAVPAHRSVMVSFTATMQLNPVALPRGAKRGTKYSSQAHFRPRISLLGRDVPDAGPVGRVERRFPAHLLQMTVPSLVAVETGTFVVKVKRIWGVASQRTPFSNTVCLPAGASGEPRPRRAWSSARTFVGCDSDSDGWRCRQPQRCTSCRL